jgi:hypothetical protein
MRQQRKPRRRGYTHADRQFTPEERRARRLASLANYQPSDKPCEVSRCRLPRYSISRHCEKHWRANKTYGHPEAHAIRFKVLRPVYRRVMLVLKKIDPEAVRLALEICDRLVVQSGREPLPVSQKTPQERRRYRLLRELFRLQHPDPNHFGRPDEFNKGPVTPIQALRSVLTVICAVWLDPELIPNDGKCLSFAIGRCVFGLRTHHAVRAWITPTRQAAVTRRIPPGFACFDLGEALRAELAPLLILVKPRMRLHIERGRRKIAVRALARARRQQIAGPVTPSVATDSDIPELTFN